MGVSAVLRPVGPQPARVYWTRRAVVLALLVVLLIGIAHVLGGGGGGNRAASLVSTPTPTPTADPAPTPTAPGRPSVCHHADLVVTASTDATTYPAGVLPHLSAVVRNASAQPCRFVTSPAQRSWTIASGTDQVWDSLDCTLAGVKARSRLGAGHTVAYTLVWNRHRSANGCPASTPAAGPGTYRLTVTINGVSASPVVFHLTD